MVQCFFSKYLGKKETKKGFNIDMSQLPSDYYTLLGSNGEELFVKKLDLRSTETLVLDKKITFLGNQYSRFFKRFLESGLG